MTTAIATNGAWSKEQIEVLKEDICPGASDEQLKHFGMVCAQTNLNPFTRQILAIMRRTKVWDKKTRRKDWVEKMVITTTIDGFRIVAERSGKYGGQTQPEWCGEDGVWKEVWLSRKPPAACRVGVRRKDWAEPLYAVAVFSEYVQTYTNEGKEEPSGLWGTKPATMIRKCAEMLALRQAFPMELSGLYGDAEMGHEAPPIEAEPVAEAPQKPQEALPAPPKANGRPKEPTDHVGYVEAVNKAFRWCGLTDAEGEAVAFHFDGRNQNSLAWMRRMLRENGGKPETVAPVVRKFIQAWADNDAEFAKGDAAAPIEDEQPPLIEGDAA